MWDLEVLKAMRPICDCEEKKHNYVTPAFHERLCAYRAAATIYLEESEATNELTEVAQ